MLNSYVERSQWGPFFDRLTRGHGAVPGQATARLTVIRPEAGAYPSDEAGERANDADLAHDGVWLPFNGVRWDEEAGAITVALEGLEHRIRSPLVVWAHVNMGGAVRSLNILGGPGCRDEVTFRMADLLRPGAA